MQFLSQFTCPETKSKKKTGKGTVENSFSSKDKNELK